MEFVFLLIGFFIGWFFTRVNDVIEQRKRMEKIDEFIDTKINELKTKIIPSRIEQTDAGMLLLYNSDTNEFLGQGLTMEELETTVKSRYPGKLFNVPQDQLDKYVKGLK